MSKRRKRRSAPVAKRDPKTIAFWAFMAVALVAGAGMYWATSVRASDVDSSYTSAYTPDPKAAASVVEFDVPADPRLLIIGDSYSVGYAADDQKTQGWAYVVANRLGWDYRVDAMSGTGWTWGAGTDGTGPYKYRDRIATLAGGDFTPNVVFLQGGQNDYRVPVAEIAAVVRDSIEQLRAQWPGVQVLVFGPAAPQPLGANLSAISTAIGQGAIMATAPYINPVQEQWITVANTPQYGHSDGSHLNTAGHAYLADRFLQEFATIAGA